MDSNISFGAKFIQKIPIKQYSYENKVYTKTTANFVELNPFDIKDLDVLKKIIFEFGDNSYAGNIYFDASYISKHKHSNNPSIRFFALTRQEKSFKDLKTDTILGIAEVLEKGGKEINLNYLQTHPQFIYSYPRQPFYKRIGSAILDCLKTTHKKINVHSTPSAIQFYKKNNFQETGSYKRILTWVKNTFSSGDYSS